MPEQQAAQQQASAAPQLVIVFLDQKTQQFKVVTDQTLKLHKTGEGVTSLGYFDTRKKQLAEGEVPVVGQEYETVFVPIMNYAIDIVMPKKVELATEVPAVLKKTSRVNKKK